MFSCFPRLSRSRRQAEGSGEEDDDYDYEYDGNEDDEEQSYVFDAILFSTWYKISFFYRETVTEVPAITTHAHRHHHGDGDKVSDRFFETILENSNKIKQWYLAVNWVCWLNKCVPY